MKFNYLVRLLTILILALAIVSQASCFKDADIYTVATEVTAEGAIVQKPRLVNIAQLQKEAAASGPKVRVDAPVHNFGRLDPLSTHQHSFVVRNDGDEPLELSVGPTTCKCTVANLTHGTVPPGGTTQVQIQWNTGRDLEYSHSATIFTNDPRNQLVRLKVKGEVQVLLRCEPEQLTFSRVAPGETCSASTLVYSQIWDQFQLAEVLPSRPGTTYSTQEATAEELQALKAKSAYRLTVTLPDDLPAGYFTIPVQLVAHHDVVTDSAKALGSSKALGKSEADCELLVQGKVLRRLSVYGPAVDTQGTIMMGRVPQGKGANLKLLLKMRDEQTELKVNKIETLPKSLKVRLEPYSTDGPNDAGLYHLYVELPKDAPTFRLPLGKQGRIHIEFDHPRVPYLDLPVDLIVTPKSDPTL